MGHSLFLNGPPSAVFLFNARHVRGPLRLLEATGNHGSSLLPMRRLDLRNTDSHPWMWAEAAISRPRGCPRVPVPALDHTLTQWAHWPSVDGPVRLSGGGARRGSRACVSRSGGGVHLVLGYPRGRLSRAIWLRDAAVQHEQWAQAARQPRVVFRRTRPQPPSPTHHRDGTKSTGGLALLPHLHRSRGTALAWSPSRRSRGWENSPARRG